MDPESPDNRLNGDGDKQILAPGEGPRENLISTAVKFLQNPKVMSSPLYQKKAFLEKKGLTQEEINLAVQRSGVKESAEVRPHEPQQEFHNGIISPNALTPIPPRSAWAKARDVTFTTVIVASVSYVVYQLFKKYFKPWQAGKSIQEKRMERLESQLLDVQKSVNDSLAELNKTLSNIQITIQTQQSQQQVGYTESRGISELKSDIASLKGLLLNRSQFPPAPTTTPILPSWQRAPNATENSLPKSYSETVKMSSTSAEQNSSETVVNSKTDNTRDSDLQQNDADTSNLTTVAMDKAEVMDSVDDSHVLNHID
ncbi:peroxisomal membrane protein PEX14-like [Physella acuta]|uniref:peroxisomal membrane protein PEX14-like n=1 Tax=Physella acuta TaxID=109671 RepID=UPI0027DE74F3|nr:peroxisomal membrane protein PEX14-like [Physella acuta]